MVVRQVTKQVYTGYVPARLGQNRVNSPFKPWHKVYGKPPITVYPKPILPEWTETPQYPPLDKVTLNDIDLRDRLKWYDDIKAIPTADKKFKYIIGFALENPAAVLPKCPYYDSLNFNQYITRTNLINKLPDCYSSPESNSNYNITDDLLNSVKDSILNQVYLPQEDKFRKVQHIIRAAKKILTNSPVHLFQSDYNAHMASWWWNSALLPPEEDVSGWGPYYDEYLDSDGNMNQLVQHFCQSAVNLRSNKMLKPFLTDTDENVMDTSKVPKSRYPLKFFGAEYKEMRPVMTAGVWNEKTPEYDCPHTCILDTACLDERIDQLTVKKFDDNESCLNSQALLTGFSWLNSIAGNHGFTPYQEITYPFICQIITTDGQNWMFNIYQLNTHTFHRDLDERNKNNVMWSSGLMKLYDELVDGSYTNVNLKVIEYLVKFMSYNETYEPEQIRPYLSEDTRTELERYLEFKELKRLYGNFFDPYKYKHTRVALWEKIFFRHPELKQQLQLRKPFHVDFNLDRTTRIKKHTLK